MGQCSEAKQSSDCFLTAKGHGAHGVMDVQPEFSFHYENGVLEDMIYMCGESHFFFQFLD